ncbi:MAG: hypothetical protein AAFX78_16260 [Cyanobacteria bacterium J06638_20]
MTISPLVAETIVLPNRAEFSFQSGVFSAYVARLYLPDFTRPWQLAGYISLLVDLPIIGRAIAADAKLLINEPRLIYLPEFRPVSTVYFSPVSWLERRTANFDLWGIDEI